MELEELRIGRDGWKVSISGVSTSPLIEAVGVMGESVACASQKRYDNSSPVRFSTNSPFDFAETIHFAFDPPLSVRSTLATG